MASSVTTYLPNNQITVTLAASSPPVIGPIIQGANRPTWVVTVKDSTDAALNLSTATFAGVLQHAASSTRITCTVGSYAITSASSGIFTYSPVSGDVAEPGTYLWETTVTISGNTYKVRATVVILPDA